MFRQQLDTSFCNCGVRQAVGWWVCYQSKDSIRWRDGNGAIHLHQMCQCLQQKWPIPKKQWTKSNHPQPTVSTAEESQRTSVVLLTEMNQIGVFWWTMELVREIGGGKWIVWTDGFWNDGLRGVRKNGRLFCESISFPLLGHILYFVLDSSLRFLILERTFVCWFLLMLCCVIDMSNSFTFILFLFCKLEPRRVGTLFRLMTC